MSNHPQYNPYSASQPAQQPFQQSPPPASNGKIIAPGITLIVVGSFGMIMTLVSLVVALAGAPPVPDPNVPDWINDLEKGAHGPFAAAVQAAFILVNSLIIAGGIAMVRIKHWGLALTATIVAMLNFGNLCCLFGLPVGIWSLVILLQSDVQQRFKEN